MRKLRLAFLMVAAVALSGATAASAAPPPVQLHVGATAQLVPGIPGETHTRLLVPVRVKCDPQLGVTLVEVFVQPPPFSNPGTEVAPCTGRWEAIVVSIDGDFVLGKATVDASIRLGATFPPVFVHRQIHIVA